ncbi:hypothetical protein Glove_208g134 [Diversispora epigaea]|uniref:Uncharacterized protein n=1 Tax=Diversispora epigaea TaxID=1348612 RepID=A0A397ITN7_9GLOM|nr:hypothetical protein Glove_208g134 [Diversispora epigaea]
MGIAKGHVAGGGSEAIGKTFFRIAVPNDPLVDLAKSRVSYFLLSLPIVCMSTILTRIEERNQSTPGSQEAGPSNVPSEISTRVKQGLVRDKINGYTLIKHVFEHKRNRFEMQLGQGCNKYSTFSHIYAQSKKSESVGVIRNNSKNIGRIPSNRGRKVNT